MKLEFLSGNVINSILYLSAPTTENDLEKAFVNIVTNRI